MENQDKHLPELEQAVRYLAGESGPEEAMHVDAWRKQSKENEKFFTDHEKLWRAAGNQQSPYQNPDMDVEWRRMQQQANAEKRPTRWLALRVAAAVVLLSGCFALAYLYFTPSPKQAYTWIEETVDSASIRNTQLPDSSVIVLNKGAHLAYTTQFAKDNRTVSFNGEAFF